MNLINSILIKLDEKDFFGLHRILRDLWLSDESNQTNWTPWPGPVSDLHGIDAALGDGSSQRTGQKPLGDAQCLLVAAYQPFDLVEHHGLFSRTSNRTFMKTCAWF